MKLPKDHSTGAHKKIKFLTFAQVTSLLNFMQSPYEITIGEHTRVDDTGLAYHVPCYKSQHQFTVQDRIVVHLTIDSGLRKQELLGLCWNAIDFDTQKISIHQAVSNTKAGEILKSLKNSSSERSLTIGNKSIQLLKQWKAEQETLCATLLLAAGIMPVSQMLVRLASTSVKRNQTSIDKPKPHII